ncbi:ATP-binding protein [Nocardioides sp. SOB77]|uniref:ATP-binding protein n=1 Tax=Nocardioides oceani TaxID=3058369 RepID=A0ABT8FMF9_9ACTN|nr:ATP-binding protein [Nocardioides oceani]MDN4175852.1 ATP-binding protein [Nocardioides oceani]
MTATSHSFYLGSGKGRSALTTWDEVEIAAAAGVLEESAWVELKQAVPASSKPANQELARDLASLSVDGGTLIIGVTDKSNDVVGTDEPAAAITTRIIQVAGTVISPPLFVDVRLLPNAGGDRHVVLVSVPASGSAPHMVGGKYFGRSAEGKRVLSDTEVERLMLTRRARIADMDRELHDLEETLDPGTDPALAQHGHLAFLARPRFTPATTLTEALAGTNPLQLAHDARDFEPRWTPWGITAGIDRPHPAGILISSDDPRLDRVAPEEFRYQLHLRDDGAVLGLFTGATYAMSESHHSGATEAILSGYLLEGVHVLTRLAAHLGVEKLRYSGEYDLGLLLTNIHGLYASAKYSNFGNWNLHPYPAPEYTRHTTSSSTRMLEETPAVVQQLLEPLLRTLGVDKTFFPYQRGEQIYERSEASKR